MQADQQSLLWSRVVIVLYELSSNLLRNYPFSPTNIAATLPKDVRTVNILGGDAVHAPPKRGRGRGGPKIARVGSWHRDRRRQIAVNRK